MENIVINPAESEGLANLAEGMSVKLSIEGTVESANEDGSLNIAVTSVSGQEGNPAEATANDLMGKNTFAPKGEEVA